MTKIGAANARKVAVGLEFVKIGVGNGGTNAFGHTAVKIGLEKIRRFDARPIGNRLGNGSRETRLGNIKNGQARPLTNFHWQCPVDTLILLYRKPIQIGPLAEFRGQRSREFIVIDSKIGQAGPGTHFRRQ